MNDASARHACQAFRHSGNPPCGETNLLSLSFIHGVALGLPLMVLAVLCVSYTSHVGKIPRLLERSRTTLVRRWLWGGLLLFSWLTPLSGLVLMYAGPHRWMVPPETWQSLALPWMASWGCMVPIAATTCLYLTRRARRRRAQASPWLTRVLWGLMGFVLGNILLTALLGSLTTQGLFYR